MRQFIVMIFSALFSAHAAGQYFHETLSLQYNLLPELRDNKTAKFSLMTWSYLKYKKTVPNLIDNFKVDSRFAFLKSKRKILFNAELGVSLQGMIPGRYTEQSVFNHRSMRICLFGNSGSTNIFIPGIQYLKTWKPQNSKDMELFFGMGLRFLITGSEYYHDSIFPAGFDASFIWRIKVFTLQVRQSYNSLYSGLRYKSDDLADKIYAQSDKITIPDENLDISSITISFGDPYFRRTSPEEKVVYNVYFTARNLFPTDGDAFREFSFENLDYIAGFRINYRKLIVNPEYIYRNTIDVDEVGCESQSVALIAGYNFRRWNILAGFVHETFYPCAVDLRTLKDDVTFYKEKLIICLEHSL
jgi:hypothetical protein